jgi:hypothetical protein
MISSLVLAIAIYSPIERVPPGPGLGTPGGLKRKRGSEISKHPHLGNRSMGILIKFLT